MISKKYLTDKLHTCIAEKEREHGYILYMYMPGIGAHSETSGTEEIIQKKFHFYLEFLEKRFKEGGNEKRRAQIKGSVREAAC